MAVAFFLILGATCSETSLTKQTEEADEALAIIEVSPSAVDFGGLAAGETATATITVTNTGAVQLWVEAIELDSAAFTLVDDGGLLTTPLSPKGSAELVVAYSPVNPADTAWMVVHSDAANEPEARVELDGAALLPGLVLDPGELVFADTPIGEAGTQTIALVNTGDAALTVTSVTVNGDDAFAGVFASPVPAVIEGGTSLPVDVTFAPADHGRYTGTVWVGSDSPAGPVSASLYGTSGVPVAVCEADPPEVYAGYERANFLGSASYDPYGLAITNHDWTLTTKPAGSAARLGPSLGTGDIEGFDPDLAGTYEATLIVRNELGVASDPCVATLEAIPAESLWVEMFWAHEGDDMDLHLQAGAMDAALIETDADCYFANCIGVPGLDWGVAGEPEDDPSLDLDDIPGTGPENINIDRPAEGTYTVWVEDYNGTVWNGENEVTVRVYVDGALVWEDERVLTTEDHDEPFCEIDWPSGAVRSL